MAYQTGTATDSADLLDKLRAFLLANGWTIEAWRFRIAQPSWRWLAVSKSGFFFNFAVDLSTVSTRFPANNHIRTRWATSYASGSDFQAQPGGAGSAVGGDVFCGDIVGPYTAYHFFEGVGASGPYAYAAVEISAGEFRHFGVGVLDKAGTYTGGEFSFGTVWSADPAAGVISDPTSAQHMIPFDSSSSANATTLVATCTSVRCVESGGGGEVVGYAGAPTGRMLRCGGWLFNETSQGAFSRGSLGYEFYRAGPTTVIGLAPLIRVQCFAERSSGLCSFIGEPPNFRHIRMDFLNPGDEITLGTEVWKVFPYVRKGTTPNIRSSGNIGIAYRRSP